MKAKKDGKFPQVPDFSGNEDINMNKNQLIMGSSPTSKDLYHAEIATCVHDTDPAADDVARPLTQFRNISGPPIQ